VFTGFTLAGRDGRETPARENRQVALRRLRECALGDGHLDRGPDLLIVKFTEGAWIIAVVGPFMYIALIRLNKQYVREERAFEAVSGRAATMNIRMNRVVVFVDTYDSSPKGPCCTASLSTPIPFALSLRHRPDRHCTPRREVGAPGTASAGITLEIVECDDRRVDRAALELVADVVRDPEVFCMVILPRRGYVSRLQRFLHDRSADAIAGAIMHVPRTAATIVPYRAVRRISEGAMQRHAQRRSRARRNPRQRTFGRGREAGPASTTPNRSAVWSAPIRRDRRESSLDGDYHESGGHELRCVIADNSGSVTLVFQGRSTIPASSAVRDYSFEGR